MNKILIPDYYVKCIFDIDFLKLREMGIKNIIIDIDNTLVPWGVSVPDSRALQLLKELRSLKFGICLLSNNRGRKVENFKKGIDVERFNFGIKPMKIMFRGAMKKLSSCPENTCIIGDQIFTDILGGKRCGIKTILVDPITVKEFPTTYAIRSIERKIKKNLNYSKEITRAE